MTCVPILDLNAIASADLPRTNHAPLVQNLGAAVLAVQWVFGLVIREPTRCNGTVLGKNGLIGSVPVVPSRASTNMDQVKLGFNLPATLSMIL